MFCYYCGKENKDGAAFCTYCGKALRRSAGTPAGKPPKKKRKSSGLAAALLGILLVLVLAAGGVFALAWLDIVEIPFLSELFEDENAGHQAREEDAETDPGTTETAAPTEDPEEVLYQQVIAACEDLAEQGDYQGAVAYLRTCGLDLEDSETAELMEQYLQLAVDDVLRAASACAEVGNYREAAQHLLHGMEWCDSEALQERLDSYRPYLTMPMVSCAVLDNSNLPGKTSDVSVGNWRDIHGIDHPDALRFWVVSKSGYNNTEYIVYHLNGNFATLSGQIVSDSDSDADSNSVIMVYLDDVLVYTSPEITMSSAAVPFTIDVGDAETMRIVCTTDSASFHYCIVDAALSEI